MKEQSLGSYIEKFSHLVGCGGVWGGGRQTQGEIGP